MHIHSRSSFVRDVLLPLLLLLTLVVFSACSPSSSDGGGGSGSSSDSASGDDDGTGGTETFTVKASVSGLQPGFPVTLSYDGTDIDVTSNGSTTLEAEAEDGLEYEFEAHPLMRCDGTGLSGTVDGSDVTISVTCEFLVYFAGSTDGSNYQLWVTDGTEDGTEHVADIPSTGSPRPRWFAFYKGRLYFVADGEDGEENDVGVELFSYDTDDGVELVADLNSGSGSSDPNQLLVHDGLLYFTAREDGEITGLYSFDGESVSEDLTEGELSGDIEELTVYDGALMFNASFGDDVAEELYMAADDEVTLAADLDPDAEDEGAPIYLSVANGVLYFEAFVDGKTLLHQYTHDDGASELPDLMDGGSNSLRGAVVLNGTTYMAVDSDEFGMEMFEWDGEDFILADDAISEGSLEMDFLTVYDGRIVFAGEDGDSEYGNELWMFDGSETTLLKNVRSGAASSDPESLDYSRYDRFSVVNGYLLFAAYQDATGYELWRTDGTTAGTQMVVELASGTSYGIYGPE